MKTLISLMLSGMICLTAFGQTFTGSHPTLSSVVSNPSLISSTNNKTEIQVFSANASFSGNQSYFSIAHLSPRNFSNTIFQNPNTVSGSANIDVMGPSFMKKINRNTFALFTRVRMNGITRNFDGSLAHSLNEQYFSAHPLPFNLSSSHEMSANLNAWTELGFSFSRELLSNENHKISAGASIRLLTGVASADMCFGPFHGVGDYNKSIKAFAINEATGTIEMQLSGLKVSGLNLNKVIVEGNPALANVKIKGDGNNFPAFRNRGVGADVGFTYEFKSDEESDDHDFRLAIAVVDIGSIRFKKDMRQSGSYKINIQPSTPLKLKELYNLDLPKARQLFDRHPENFQPLPDNSKSQFNSNLPTSLNVDLDQRISEKIFIGSSSHIALTNASWSYVSVIPRYETEKFALAVPVTYDWLSKSRAGIFLKYRFLSLGSSGLFTSIVQPTRQLDASLGATVGIR
jgi:hypothetical protein